MNETVIKKFLAFLKLQKILGNFCFSEQIFYRKQSLPVSNLHKLFSMFRGSCPGQFWWEQGVRYRLLRELGLKEHKTLPYFTSTRLNSIPNFKRKGCTYRYSLYKGVPSWPPSLLGSVYHRLLPNRLYFHSLCFHSFILKTVGFAQESLLCIIQGHFFIAKQKL